MSRDTQTTFLIFRNNNSTLFRRIYSAKVGGRTRYMLRKFIRKRYSDLSGTSQQVGDLTGTFAPFAFCSGPVACILVREHNRYKNERLWNLPKIVGYDILLMVKFVYL